MTEATGLVNVLLGVAYLAIGSLAAYDLWRGWRVLGASHFGLAFVGLAFTCGPHHLDHGAHVLLGDRVGQPLDLATVLVGLPAAVTFFVLRIEASLGGRGDRFVAGTPRWLAAAPTLGAVYGTAVTAVAIDTIASSATTTTSQQLPNVVLMAVYAAIGWVLLRTQLHNRRTLGGWSLSGMSLMGVFFTCTLMHGAWVLYGSTGAYGFDDHGFLIDWVSVPAGTYFLAVVWALHRDAIRDWNSAVRAGVGATAGAVSAR